MKRARDDPFVSKLSSTTVNDLLSSKSKQLVSLSSNATLKHCLEMLAEHDILSAPVMEGDKFLGFVDVLDIADYTLHRYRLETEKFQDPAFVESAFLDEAVSEVINFSKVDSAYIISPKSSVHELVHLMTKTKSHRVAVVEQKGKKPTVVGIVTQSDIIRFASQNLELIPNAKVTIFFFFSFFFFRSPCYRNLHQNRCHDGRFKHVGCS